MNGHARLAMVLVCAAVSAAVVHAQVQVSTSAELVAAVNNGVAGTTIQIAPGVYEVPSSLLVKSGMTIAGAGAGLTTIRNGPTFQVAPASWYGSDTDFQQGIPSGYLFDLGRDQSNITLRDMTLTGPEVLGGVHASVTNGLTLTGMMFKDFRWSGVRTYICSNVLVSGNTFIDAGGQTVNPDGSFGVTGGCMFMTYLSNARIENNRFVRTEASPDEVYGIKGREFRNVVIAFNTIRTFFSIELPFENDYYVDIENNYLGGAVSVPKFAGGALPPTGSTPYTFRVRRNLFTTSYAIEGPRNGMIVEQNVFLNAINDDGGNTMSSFDPFSETPAVPGPLDFNNNIVINPGRGVFWSDVVWNNLSFRNNHILVDERIASEFPQGLFGFRVSSPALGGQVTNFGSIAIRDNFVRVVGGPRTLFRSTASYGSAIAGNTLVGVLDAGQFPNPPTGAAAGLQAPLAFAVGVNGEQWVDGAALLRLPRVAKIAVPVTGGASGVIERR